MCTIRLSGVLSACPLLTPLPFAVLRSAYVLQFNAHHYHQCASPTIIWRLHDQGASSIIYIKCSKWKEKVNWVWRLGRANKIFTYNIETILFTRSFLGKLSLWSREHIFDTSKCFKDVQVGIPKSDLLGISVALIHVAGQQFLAVYFSARLTNILCNLDHNQIFHIHVQHFSGNQFLRPRAALGRISTYLPFYRWASNVRISKTNLELAIY